MYALKLAHQDGYATYKGNVIVSDEREGLSPLDGIPLGTVQELPADNIQPTIPFDTYAAITEARAGLHRGDKD